MFRKELRFGSMVLVFALLVGCMSACSLPNRTADQVRIDELEEELERLEEELESVKEERDSDPAPTQEPIPTPTVEPTPSPTPSPTPKADRKYELTVWSYTDEMKAMAIAFMAEYPEIQSNYVEIPTDGGEYKNQLLAKANTDEGPDVVALEAGFVKEFVDRDDFLLDISDLKPYADALRTHQNTIDMGTNNATGEIRAYSYQNNIGVVFYRRSLAVEYFGTDDPAEIQAMMSDWDKYTDMAATIKQKSGGKTFMISSVEEFRFAFFQNRNTPWIVDDTLFIDPMIDEFTDISKTFGNNGYTAEVLQWYQEWFNGMTDSLIDENSRSVQIFSYFLPTWGLPYVLMLNARSTAGDWACVPGPMPYAWGGTWVGVMENAREPEIAKEFVRFCALDEQNLTNWAMGVYTHSYLSSIDRDMAGPAGDGALSQPAGDFVSSQKVVEAITASFDDSEFSRFLGGQNFYAVFAEVGPNCRADVAQGSDDAIQNYFVNALLEYSYEGISKEEMMQMFKSDVAVSFRNIDVE
ncbi:MAG: carbohydrate ABC transporter substrate-binding protein [Clostridiales bacterium]|nr:carbohydrate ABC transporter substrate-binding protein [Clostridiales bacterium]